MDAPTTDKLNEFENAMGGRESEDLAKELVAKHSKSPDLLIPLCKSLISDDVKKNLSVGSHPMRHNNFCSKLLTAYGNERMGVPVQRTQNLCKDLVKDVKVVPAVKPSILATQVELDKDPLYKSMGEELKKLNQGFDFEIFEERHPNHPLVKQVRQLQANNKVVVRKMAKTLLDSTLSDESMNAIPDDMAQVSAEIFKEAQQRYPLDKGTEEEKAKNKVECLRLVGGFLMLRMINPAITTTIKPTNKEETVQQHTLVMVSKFLQNASNAVPFKEEDFQDFNDMIEEYSEKMTDALEKVVLRGQQPRRQEQPKGQGLDEEKLELLDQALINGELDHAKGYLEQMGIGKGAELIDVIKKLSLIQNDPQREQAYREFLLRLKKSISGVDPALQKVLNQNLQTMLQGW